VPKGSLEISDYYPPAPVSKDAEEPGRRPGTTPEHSAGRLTANVLALLSSRRILMAFTVIGLYFLLGCIFAINTVTAARSSVPASHPLEVTFFSSETSAVVGPPINPEPLLTASFHLPEFPAILIEEEQPIPSSSMAITIPAPNEPRPERVQPPPALNAAAFTAETVRAPCAAPHPVHVTEDCRTR
jgi:hypothetical protein